MIKLKTPFALIAVGVVSLSTAVAFTSSPVSAQPLPSGKTYVSGIDIKKACTQQIGTPHAVINITGDVMGWRCQYRSANGLGPVTAERGVNLTVYCQRNHSGTNPYYTNFHDRFSWGCYR